MYAKRLLLLSFLLTLGTGISCAASSLSPEDTTEKKFSLDMKGRVMMGKKPLSKALVRIYSDSSGVLLSRMETDNEGWVAFPLLLQKGYSIRISKDGYVTKTISLDARMPKLYYSGDYYFEFSMDLFESIEGLDVSVLKEPVAKIFFNTFTKNFDYDFNYTAKINKDIKKLYAEYAALKKQGKKTVITPSAPEDTVVKTQQPKTDSATVVKDAGPKTTYSVEILSSETQLPRNSPLFKGVVNVKEILDGTTYKYYVGSYATLKDAEKMKENLAGYFPGASIVSFVDGKK